MPYYRFFPPQLVAIFGSLFWIRPFWPVKETLTRRLPRQRFSEFSIRPRLPPKRLIWNLVTGASGTLPPTRCLTNFGTNRSRAGPDERHQGHCRDGGEAEHLHVLHVISPLQPFQTPPLHTHTPKLDAHRKAHTLFHTLLPSNKHIVTITTTTPHTITQTSLHPN